MTRSVVPSITSAVHGALSSAYVVSRRSGAIHRRQPPRNTHSDSPWPPASASRTWKRFLPPRALELDDARPDGSYDDSLDAAVPSR